jgi:hypothetical protein
MLDKSKEILKPYVKSKRVGLGATLIALLGIAQQFGMVVDPLVALGVYLIGNVLTKYIDETQK